MSKEIIIPKEIEQEGFRWLNNNKELTCKPKDYYFAPRISSEYLDCSMPLTFDSYNFCSLSCFFCFAYYFRSSNPTLMSDANHLKLKSINYDKFEKQLTGKLPNDPSWKNFFSKRYILQWGSMGDPFCEFERKNRVGEKLIKLFGDLNYPVKFCFKGKAISEYMKLFEKYAHQHNFVFQSSIINTDDKMSSLIEMGALTPTQRFKFLGELSAMNYWTIARLRPFIVGMSDLTLDDFLEKILKYKINAISLEFFCLDVRANENVRNRYKWMSKVLGYDIFDYYKKLSPTYRGGYRRLNRDVKERWVRKIYKFCYDNNVLFACSDPDYKELNYSGSCCGLPLEYPDNPDITRYCRAQMTNALRLMRKAHWQGKEQLLSIDWFYSLDDVFKDHFDDLDLFSQDCVEKIGISSGEASTYTMRKAISKHWNNLRSPKNVMRYFAGKLAPVGKDEHGDLIFKYVESPYEKIWTEKYGIDLSKY